MRKYIKIFSCFLLIFFINAFGQNVKNGIYVGYEQNPFCYQSACIKDYKKIKPVKNQLYYKIILSVDSSNVTLTKVPVIFINKRNQKVDSTKGGYYSYEIDISKDRVFGSLKNYKYTNWRSCAKPKFSYTYYKYTVAKNSILLNNEYNKNIVLKKVK